MCACLRPAVHCVTEPPLCEPLQRIVAILQKSSAKQPVELLKPPVIHLRTRSQALTDLAPHLVLYKLHTLDLEQAEKNGGRSLQDTAT